MTDPTRVTQPAPELEPASEPGVGACEAMNPPAPGAEAGAGPGAGTRGRE